VVVTTIDTAYKLHFLLAKEYYHYRYLNYVIQDCPTRFDIWQLTAEQWEELMKDLNTLKDIEAFQQLKSADSDNDNSISTQDFI